MANEKKNSSLTIRIEPELAERLKKLEVHTGRSRGDIVRRSLEAVLVAFEAQGHIEFPVSVAPQSPELREEVLNQLVDRMLEKHGDTLVEMAAQRAQQRIDDHVLAKIGGVPPSLPPPANGTDG